MNDIVLHHVDIENLKKFSGILDTNLGGKFFCSYDNQNTLGVFFDNQLVGLFTLKKFIGNTLAIHMILLPEYRGKGIGSTTINKIVNELGQNYPNIEYFIANTSDDNKKAIDSLIRAGWKKTYEYDEEMDNEGSEFFVIYQKENPYYSKKVKQYTIFE